MNGLLGWLFVFAFCLFLLFVSCLCFVLLCRVFMCVLDRARRSWTRVPTDSNSNRDNDTHTHTHQKPTQKLSTRPIKWISSHDFYLITFCFYMYFPIFFCISTSSLLFNVGIVIVWFVCVCRRVCIYCSLFFAIIICLPVSVCVVECRRGEWERDSFCKHSEPAGLRWPSDLNHLCSKCSKCTSSVPAYKTLRFDVTMRSCHGEEMTDNQPMWGWDGWRTQKP